MRDRFIDAVRALGTVTVVLLHWLMPVVTWDGQRLSTGNALAGGVGWAITWATQVMPLMFFAAGAASLHSLRRADIGAWPFLRGRLRGLLAPVLVFLITWAILAPSLVAMGVPAAAVKRAAGIAPQLLWFVAVYILLVALAPWLVRLHRRFGWWLPIGLAGAAAAVDIARFATGLHPLGYLNAAFVWLVPFLLGFAYADGSLGRIGRHGLLLSAAGGLAGLTGLVVLGPYPASLIGMPGDPMSNMNPPTVCLVAATVYQVALAVLARPLVLRLLERPRNLRVLEALRRNSMTIYLWHFTAIIAAYGVLLVGMELTLPAPGTATWWLTRPLWLAGLMLPLALLIRMFGWAERRGLPRWRMAGTTLLGYGAAGCGVAALLLVVISGVLPPWQDGALAVLRSEQGLAVLLATLGTTLAALARQRSTVSA